MRIIRLKEVQSKTGLGKTSIYELMKAGAFPTSIKIIGNHVGWVESEIEEWIIQLIKKNRGDD